MSTSRGYHECSGGCSVHRGDIMIHVGRYHEYIMGCSVHRGMLSTSGDTMSTSGDIMSTSGDIMSTSGGYHEYIGGCSVHRSFQWKLKGFYQVAPPHVS